MNLNCGIWVKFTVETPITKFKEWNIVWQRIYNYLVEKINKYKQCT